MNLKLAPPVWQLSSWGPAAGALVLCLELGPSSIRGATSRPRRSAPPPPRCPPTARELARRRRSAAPRLPRRELRQRARPLKPWARGESAERLAAAPSAAPAAAAAAGRAELARSAAHRDGRARGNVARTISCATNWRRARDAVVTHLAAARPMVPPAQRVHLQPELLLQYAGLGVDRSPAATDDATRVAGRRRLRRRRRARRRPTRALPTRRLLDGGGGARRARRRRPRAARARARRRPTKRRERGGDAAGDAAGDAPAPPQTMSCAERGGAAACAAPSRAAVAAITLEGALQPSPSR